MAQTILRHSGNLKAVSPTKAEQKREFAPQCNGCRYHKRGMVFLQVLTKDADVQAQHY